LQDIDPASGSIAFLRGGWQEARGAEAGDYLYYENLRSELDWAGEWFVDAPSSTLFYVANGTDAPPADGWVASQLDNVVSVLGDAGVPARGVELAGLAFMHTATTFMQPFTVPSGGDMSYHDGGAVRLRGTEGCAVRSSLLKNLGGSGVMISGYNLDTVVDSNEFLFLGEHAVCSMGRGDRQDQTDGDYPTRNQITNNFAHEFGLYVKQTGFYYHGISKNATISSNVFFNGPRAGISEFDWSPALRHRPLPALTRTDPIPPHLSPLSCSRQTSTTASPAATQLRATWASTSCARRSTTAS